LLWVLHLPTDEQSLAALPDQMEYRTLAKNWLASGIYQFHDDRFHQDVLAYRTPGYPALIALCGGSIRLTRIAQALIDASSILAIWILAGRWLSDRAALTGVWFVCLSPWLIYFSGLLLSETLYTALLTWGMVLLSRSGRWRIGGMFLLAVSVLVRPSAVLLPVILTAIVAKNRWRDAGIALALTVAMLAPWAARNHARLGQWIWLTTNGGITLYDGLNPSATGASDQRFVRSMPELQSMGEVQRDRYLHQAAMQFAEEHPARVIQLSIAKILRTWSPIPLGESYRDDVRYIAIGLAYSLPLFAMAIAGLFARSLSGETKGFLLAPAIYITLMQAAGVGSLRYRTPADVPLAVLAVSAIKNRPTASLNGGA
ncbi:MAG: glycosyltransferase family 39 protein, partial [Phycisphaerae bacterium]|nr:glycosyltransferase family 39 protein [Phycisphaerae bacterium]